MEIKVVETKEKLKEVFVFLSRLFFEDAKEYNEHYYTMPERFTEMSNQFEKDNELLLYIEENKKIVAAITAKNMDTEKKKITLGIIGVSKEYRRKGYAKLLIEEFEKICKKKNIMHVDLGARFRACPLYIEMGYKPSLMIQVFDFTTIQDIRKANTFNLKETSSWQGDTGIVLIHCLPALVDELLFLADFH
mgnify:CR=1 FL=1